MLVNFVTINKCSFYVLQLLGEGNGNPLQCSCLENPRDGGAWQAAVYGVAQSRTSQVALVVKNPPASAGDMKTMDSIPGLGRSPGGGHDYPLQYSCLENPMDRGVWRTTVHRVSKSWTQLQRLSIHAHGPLTGVR